MRKRGISLLWSGLRRTVSTIFSIALVLAVVLLLFIAFLGPPVDLALVTWDMFRMTSVATGRVIDSSIEYGDSGSSGSRPVIEYEYTVDGDTYRGNRLAPGWAANHGVWSGGGTLVHRYPVGRSIVVHYDQDDPTRAVLEYGWFKWSLGILLGTWGLWVIRDGGLRRLLPLPDARWHRALGSAMAITGVALIAFHPGILAPIELLWVLLAVVLLTLLERGRLSWRQRRSIRVRQGRGIHPAKFEAADPTES